MTSPLKTSSCGAAGAAPGAAGAPRRVAAKAPMTDSRKPFCLRWRRSLTERLYSWPDCFTCSAMTDPDTPT